jgi:hypothetical protein
MGGPGIGALRPDEKCRIVIEVRGTLSDTEASQFDDDLGELLDKWRAKGAKLVEAKKAPLAPPTP